MQHAVGAVGAVQRCPGTENDLDPFDILVDKGDEVVHVDTQGGDAGDTVVRQRQQGAAEDVVETAGDDVALHQSGLGEIDPGLVAHVRGHAEDGTRGDIIGEDDGDRCRGIEGLLLGARGGDDAQFQVEQRSIQGDVEAGAGGVEAHVGANRGAEADVGNADSVAAGAQTRHDVVTGSPRHGAHGSIQTAAGDGDVHPGKCLSVSVGYAALQFGGAGDSRHREPGAHEQVACDADHGSSPFPT